LHFLNLAVGEDLDGDSNSEEAEPFQDFERGDEHEAAWAGSVGRHWRKIVSRQVRTRKSPHLE